MRKYHLITSKPSIKPAGIHTSRISFLRGIIPEVSRILLLILLMFSISACSSLSHKPVSTGIPRSERAGLAVLNFRNNSANAQAYQFQPWEYGIATMVATDLESVGIFNIVERERLRDIVREQDLQYSGLVDRDKAVKIGRLAAAKYILTGSFVELNGELTMAAQIFSVEKGIQLGAASIKGETEEFFMLEKKLFIQVIGFLRVMLNEEEKARIMGNVETQSVDASLNNYSGEMAVSGAEDLKRAGKNKEALRLLEEAKEHFELALKYDPDYLRARDNLETLTMAIPITL
ncbi:MAG: hypothetical protein JXM72_03935 [Deltaproteobacteria bacterium]|nr:hypothetical protein [Deltaproteobacteria bacterium]